MMNDNALMWGCFFDTRYERQQNSYPTICIGKMGAHYGTQNLFRIGSNSGIRDIKVEMHSALHGCHFRLLQKIFLLNF